MDFLSQTFLFTTYYYMVKIVYDSIGYGYYKGLNNKLPPIRYIGMDDEHLKTIKAIAWIKKYRGENINTIFDIGANIGHISLPLIKEKMITKAYMWEPDIDNFKLLQCNHI